MTLEVFKIDYICLYGLISHGRWKRIQVFIGMWHGTVVVDAVLGWITGLGGWSRVDAAIGP